MHHAEIVRALGLHSDPTRGLSSLSSSAPVYCVRDGTAQRIVKQTQPPLSRAQAIRRWTRTLASAGIRVVTPVALAGDNPRAFPPEAETGAEIWVVYPFITGDRYRGTPAEIRAAGQLLGAIHATASQIDWGLKPQETVVVVAADELAQDSTTVLDQVAVTFPGAVRVARQTLLQRVEQYLGDLLPRLITTRLPLANCSWDYKASNLVYPTPTAPVLVDPDNAGRLPRAYDLAIAAWLFHIDAPDAPDRVFTRDEWASFVEGYGQHVQLTAQERHVWEDLLVCAWVDEALWLLSHDAEGWRHRRQANLLLSLLTTEIATLSLA